NQDGSISVDCYCCCSGGARVVCPSWVENLDNSGTLSGLRERWGYHRCNHHPGAVRRPSFLGGVESGPLGDSGSALRVGRLDRVARPEHRCDSSSSPAARVLICDGVLNWWCIRGSWLDISSRSPHQLCRQGASEPN